MELTHHAYYVEGLQNEFEPLKRALAPFWAKQFDKFGIEDSRELVRLASLKNFDRAIFMLGVPSITSEAQQALLKLFEEPQPGTVFVVLVPHGVLVPTLKSRMLPYQGSTSLSRSNLGETFLRSSQKERGELVAKLLKDDEGARERVRELLLALEAALLPRIADPAVRAGLEDIQKVRGYVGDRSASLKMLLEHLALCLPKS